MDDWQCDWSYYVGESNLGKIRIKKTRYGMHTSVHEDGRELVTGLEFETVREMTYWHLIWERDGYDGLASVKYESVVGGKL